MSNPRLSVLMPLYNGERFLPEALESILSQTFTDFELLVVDDGSSDGSASIVRLFSARDSRIRGFFLDKNVGISAAMNRGLREARAPLIARMDCDDYCDPCRFAKQVSYMDKHAGIYMLGCRSVNTDERGNRIKGKEYNVAFAKGSRQIFVHIRRGRYPLLHATLMYRTAAVLSLGGYREILTIGEDDDLYERMLTHYGCVFANLSNILYFYRRISSSNTRQYNSKKHRWVIALIRYSAEFIRQGLSDPLDFVKDLSFPPLATPKDEFNIIKFLFYLHLYRNSLSEFSDQTKSVYKLKMTRAKLSHLPKSSKIREFLDRKFFLLLLLIVPKNKCERRIFFKDLDKELFNRDVFIDSTEYSNICIVVARGCLRYGEYIHFSRYLLRAFYIDFIFALNFFWTRLTVRLGK